MKRYIILTLLLAIVGLNLSGTDSPDFDHFPNDGEVDLGNGSWKELADADAAKAYQTILKLAADPDKAVPYLRERLLAETLPTAQEVKALIGDLGSGLFAKRQAASRALERLGPAAELTLLDHLSEKNPREVQQRIEEILQKLETRKATVVELRLGRALEVLERIANVQARQTLDDVGKKHAENWLGGEARKGLARLEGHPTLAATRLRKNMQTKDDNRVPSGVHQFRYKYAALAPDGKQAIIAQGDNRAFLWNLSTRTLTREVPSNVANGALAWSPNGKFVATARYSGQIDIWNAEKWDLHRTLRGHPSDVADRFYPVELKVFHAQFSADSRTLVTGGRDESIRQWDVETGGLVGTLPLPGGMGNVDAVSPDGEFIAYHRPGQYRWISLMW